MKICPKCKCELEDIAKFCLQCGEKFQEESTDTATSIVETSATAKDSTAIPTEVSTDASAENTKNTPKKMPAWLSKFLAFFPAAGRFLKKHFLRLPVKARIILIVAVFLLIFIPCIACCGSDYRKVVRQYEKLLNQECDDYNEYLPIFFPSDLCDIIDDTYNCIDDINGDYADAVDELFENTFDEYFEEVYDDYGEYKIRIFVKKASRISNRDLKKAQNNIDDLYDDLNAMALNEATFESYLASIGADEKYAKDLEKLYKRYIKALKRMHIDKGYTLRLIVYIKGEDDSEQELIKKVHVLKIGGEWVLSTDSLLDEFPEYANPFSNLSDDAYEMIKSLKEHTRRPRAMWFEACRDWLLPGKQEVPDFAPLVDDDADAADVVMSRMQQRSRMPKMFSR